MKKILLTLSVIILLFAGCKKDDVFEEGEYGYKFTVTTNDVTDITATSARCDITVAELIAADGDIKITERGVCWSTSQNPTINDYKTSVVTVPGTFYSLTNLTPNTTYYVRAYATNSAGTGYGEQKSFKTLITTPTVTTTNVTDITQTTATTGGNVTDDGGSAIIARGICWSTSQNPTINNSHTTDGNGTGSYNSNLSNLTPNTTYYVRAYATNSAGTVYGDERFFTTLEEDGGVINGHKYVDLGLPSGLKWATCNVGADFLEDYGDYFAWGETTTKAGYTEENSLTSRLTISELQSQGIIDGDHNLTPSYDAARANWGGSWRMPTEAEQRELIYNCTLEWTTQNGVNGCKVTGPNGNSIFLPTAGYRYGSSLINAGEYGYYWSSTPYESNSNSAYYLEFSSSSYHYVGWYGRYYGRSVRPVAE